MDWAYVLADLAGAHYWTGTDFVRAGDGPFRRDEVQCFDTREQADRERARRRQRGDYLKVVRAKVGGPTKQGIRQDREAACSGKSGCGLTIVLQIQVLPLGWVVADQDTGPHNGRGSNGRSDQFR
jgi:hypothetical protein